MVAQEAVAVELERFALLQVGELLEKSSIILRLVKNILPVLPRLMMW